jgi:sortase A
VTDFAVEQPAASDDGPPEWSPADSVLDQPAGQSTPGKPVSRPKPAPIPLPPAAAVAVAMLAGIAALGLWFAVYSVFLSGLQENHTQHVLYSRLRYELAQATAPLGGAIAPRAPIAYLQIPAIGLTQVIVEGTSSDDLASGPGHLPTTPLPGQAGNSQIFGRSVTFGAPFGNVHKLRPGAIITITTGQGIFAYRVIDVRGPGDGIPTAAQFGPASLTLVTSAGRGWRNGWAPDHAIYADATLVIGKVQPAPSGRPGAVPFINDPMVGDTSELLPVFLWLGAFVLLAAGLSWAYTRWTAWQVWLVGVPSVLALLWLVTSYAILLLPNLA